MAACGLGLYLTVAETSDETLALALAYGVLGLVGFLSQIVVGVLGRVLPLFAWLWGFSDRAYAESPPSLHRAPARSLQASVLALWTVGVPLLAFGLAADRLAVVSAGAAALFVAVCAGMANAVVVLTRLWYRRAPAAAPQ
jgi:hypothetical protein